MSKQKRESETYRVNYESLKKDKKELQNEIAEKNKRNQDAKIAHEEEKKAWGISKKALEDRV